VKETEGIRLKKTVKDTKESRNLSLGTHLEKLRDPFRAQGPRTNEMVPNTPNECTGYPLFSLHRRVNNTYKGFDSKYC